MKALVLTCAVFLLAASMYGQETTQNSDTSVVAKTPNQRPAAILKEPTVLGTGDTWAVISWTTNEAGKGHATIYVGANRQEMKPMDQTLADNAGSGRVESYQEQEYSHLVRLNNLQPGTTYYFRADSGNGADHGSASKSNIWTFTTSGVAPKGATAVATVKRSSRKSVVAQAKSHSTQQDSVRQTLPSDKAQSASLNKVPGSEPSR